MVAFIEQYASIFGFFIQMGFYIIIAVSALWAAITFSKYVKFMTTEEEIVSDSKSSDEKVSVEEFVD